MIILDDRCQNILQILLRSNKPLVAKAIALEIGITPRMVRYSLRRVEAWLKDRGVILECKPNLGIMINCSSQVKAKLLAELRECQNSYYPSPSERVNMVILSLLTAHEPVLIKQLELRLFASRTTIIHDLRKAEQWLIGHHLSLISRPNYGFQVNGKERDQREAIVSLVIDNAGKKLLMALCTDSQTAFGSQVPGERILLGEFLDTMDIPFVKSLLDLAISKLQLHLSDNNYLTLFLHIGLTISRSRNGKTIEFSKDSLQGLDQERELQAAEEIANRMYQRFKFVLPNSELTYLATHFLAARRLITVNPSNSSQKDDLLDTQLQIIIEEVVAEAARYLHPFLKVDQELINSLTLHFGSVLIRLRLGLPIRNPILEHIKNQYPLYLKVAENCSAVIAERANIIIPEQEIGYIALHLGAAMERLRSKPDYRKRVIIVCVEGTATAWLLASRIRAEFPHVEIVEVYSLHDLLLNKGCLNAIDVIVSTIPVEIHDTLVVTVNPLLMPEDISRLDEVLGLETYTISELTEIGKSIGDLSLDNLITTDTIKLKVHAKNWQDVADKAGEPLIATGAINLHYIDAIKQIIKEYGPYSVTVPGVVLLHARPGDGVKRLCMSLITLSEPVRFGHPEHDPVDIALVLGTVDSHSHLNALRKLIRLLSDEGALALIRSSSDRQEVRELICHFAAG